MPNEVASINQQTQLGVEVTAGTAVAANKLLKCFDITFGVNANVSAYTPEGTKYIAEQDEDFEQADITVSGNLDYNGLPYLLNSAMGIVSPVAHGASAVAKDWIYTPPVTGSITPQTYSFQQGDAVRARSFPYGIISMFGYKGTRKTPFTVSGKGFGQSLTDGITLTPSPTAVVLAQAVGKQFNVYLDTTSAGIGTTLLTRVFSLDFSFDNIYGPFFPLNRANASFTGTVDLLPKSALKMLMAADSNGFAAMQGYLRSGATVYVRVDAQGQVIDNNQTLTIGGGATSGNFTLSYKGQTTANIAYSAALTAATIQTAFQLLSTVSTACAVSGPNGGPYTFAFSGALATDTTAMTATNVSLTGGTPTIVVTQTQAYNEIKHDMAVKVGKPTAFKDEQGIYAMEWELLVAQDPLWNGGQAQQLTVTNLITAL